MTSSRAYQSCSRCGRLDDGTPASCGTWWMVGDGPHGGRDWLVSLGFPAAWDLLCDLCRRVVTSDDSDHGDEHVESVEESQLLHAATWLQHPTRSCRVCIREGAPLSPGVSWAGGLAKLASASGRVS